VVYLSTDHVTGDESMAPTPPSVSLMADWRQ
jgi:hypothetical protein